MGCTLSEREIKFSKKVSKKNDNFFEKNHDFFEKFCQFWKFFQEEKLKMQEKCVKG
jgi:hypothetical protein